jgi:hypothetical protein
VVAGCFGRSLHETFESVRFWILILLLCAPATLAFAQEKKWPPENVRVLKGVGAEEFEDGMRMMTLALGVKCTSCHVPRNYPADDVPAKIEARKFFEAALAVKREERIAVARPLLAALKLSEPRNEPKLLLALDYFSKRAP